MVKTFLSSRAIQRKVAGQIWPTEHSLLPFNLDDWNAHLIKNIFAEVFYQTLYQQKFTQVMELSFDLSPCLSCYIFVEF